MTDKDQWRVFISDESDEWATPPTLVRPIVDAIGGFDLDPCSGAEQSPIADEIYTETDDGLSKEWYGNVWLNPPYSDISRWLQKAYHEKLQWNADVIIALVKGDTSTNWYQQYGFKADAIAFIDGRLSFGDAGQAPFPSHVLIYGTVPTGVYDVLDNHGTVLRTDIISRTTQRSLRPIGAGKEDA